MDWIQLGTLGISGVTLGKLFYDSMNMRDQLKIDRRISVTVEEKRKMQRELFNHVSSLLYIDRKAVTATFTREEMRNAISDAHNHKINVWINLNRDNKHQNSLKDECSILATFLSNFLEDPGEEQLKQYLDTTEKTTWKIWLLIDKYIEEEEKLIKNLLDK